MMWQLIEYFVVAFIVGFYCGLTEALSKDLKERLYLWE